MVTMRRSFGSKRALLELHWEDDGGRRIIGRRMTEETGATSTSQAKKVGAMLEEEMIANVLFPKNRSCSLCV